MNEKPKRRWLSFSLRTMFVVVTVVGVTVWQWQRAERLRRCADANREAALMFTRKFYEGEANKARQKKIIEYYLAMSEKCQKAIWQPWLELTPDPSNPHSVP